MTTRDLQKPQLDRMGQPEDLWGQLFFAWLKHLSELRLLGFERLRVIENSIDALEKEISKLSSEGSDELRAAMAELKEVRDMTDRETTAHLDRVEELVALAQKIIDGRSSGQG